MAESFKVTKDGRDGLLEAVEVFPDLQAQVNAGTGVGRVYDSKKDEWVDVAKGQFIVSIADRYEVHDTEPARAKPAEPEAKTAKKAEAKSDDKAE